jgi:hypothetical protein
MNGDANDVPKGPRFPATMKPHHDNPADLRRDLSWSYPRKAGPMATHEDARGVYAELIDCMKHEDSLIDRRATVGMALSGGLMGLVAGCLASEMPSIMKALAVTFIAAMGVFTTRETVRGLVAAGEAWIFYRKQLHDKFGHSHDGRFVELERSMEHPSLKATEASEALFRKISYFWLVALVISTTLLTVASFLKIQHLWTVAH